MTANKQSVRIGLPFLVPFACFHGTTDSWGNLVSGKLLTFACRANRRKTATENEQNSDIDFRG